MQNQEFLGDLRPAWAPGAGRQRNALGIPIARNEDGFTGEGRTSSPCAGQVTANQPAASTA